MGSEWRVLPFSQAVMVNPRVELTRGMIYPFVDMGAVSAGARSAHASEMREFTGGGSRFAVGDTLMARITPCLENGKIARFAGQPGEIAHGSTEFIVIRGRTGVSDTDYAYYLTTWEGVSGYAISHMTGTSGRQRVPLDALDHLYVPLPPLPEQRAIAHILGTLDDKIELNRRMSETLEAMARALFKSWFVDFDPVRAKMEGRWRRGESLPGLPAHLYDLFPDSFVDSELGEIPRGWEHIPFGSLLESTIGGDWGKDVPDDDHSEAVSIIRGTDFPDVSTGGIGKVPTRYTTIKKLASRQLQAGDIVVEISGGSPTQPTGRSIFISKATLERFSNAVVCASFCRRFRPRSSELGVLAFIHLQNLYASGGTWEYQNQSTGIANFQTAHFLESEMVVMPSAKLLGVFAVQAQSLLEKMSSNESLALIKLRDTLLPKLISGELRVKDAEKFLKERGL